VAFFDTTWYVSSVAYAAVPVWAASHTYAAGDLVRQLTAPTVGNERIFVCTTGGASGASEPNWSGSLTRGGKTIDNAVSWQECTGASAVNGDLTNTPTWTAVKGQAVTLGQIIKRNNGVSYQIANIGGTAGSGSEPGFSDTAGVATTDNTITWRSLGPVGNFTGGQAPHARLANACASTWFAAGNTIYVGDNHAESQTTFINPQPAGSSATVGRILCHNHSGSYPPTASDLRTGAVIATTASANIVLTPGGSLYVYGISFRVAVGAAGGNNFGVTASSVPVYLDNCLIDIATTAGSGNIAITGSGIVIFNNTTIKFAHTSQILAVNTTNFTWQNTGQILASGSSVPVNFINPISLISVVLEAIDLSQITGNIVTTSASAIGSVLIKDCKLNASAVFPVAGQPGVTYQLVRCDSSGTGYKSARYTYDGTETTETGITRVGGASDPAGQAQSRKIVTTANVQWLRPFAAEPYATWNAVTGANVVVTVYGTINAGALPNNDDIWIEIEYLGSSASPLGSVVKTTKASVLAANAAVASDGSTWNGGGSGAGWSPFKLTATLSSPQPAMAGYLYARVRAAKASTTYYIDPQIVLS
jgi:hypothetical protein